MKPLIQNPVPVSSTNKIDRLQKASTLTKLTDHISGESFVVFDKFVMP
jgi:hypothetical protein